MRNMSDSFRKISQFDGNDTLPSQTDEVVHDGNPFRGSKVQFKIPESSRHRSQTSESTSSEEIGEDLLKQGHLQTDEGEKTSQEG